ncbi:5-aminolevulic acid synthase [Oceaniglobus roseus]|uniref:5-aminolevulic acid synthase n=1 Tax=Oceaniglobus roseus TaxID=1737570 RepID=UPI000C7EBCCC|nr:5-aminolevulic acid synthase [Kandeliimicrobium roseum]
MTKRDMKILPRLAAATALLCGLGAAATAQTMVTGDEAKAALFPTKGARAVVFNLPGLDDKTKAVLGEVAKDQKYFGAIALAPEKGLASAQAAVNYHSVAAAERAAIAACQSAAKTQCRIAAHVLPAGYAERGLTLSVDATQGFNDSYLPAGSPKALAISPSTGQWSIAAGQGAGATATRSCNAKGAGDCQVVVAD